MPNKVKQTTTNRNDLPKRRNLVVIRITSGTTTGVNVKIPRRPHGNNRRHNNPAAKDSTDVIARSLDISTKRMKKRDQQEGYDDCYSDDDNYSDNNSDCYYDDNYSDDNGFDDDD